MIVIREPNFNWSTDVHENFKYEIEFVIKNSKSLAENKINKKVRAWKRYS